MIRRCSHHPTRLAVVTLLFHATGKEFHYCDECTLSYAKMRVQIARPTRRKGGTK